MPAAVVSKAVFFLGSRYTPVAEHTKQGGTNHKRPKLAGEEQGRGDEGTGRRIMEAEAQVQVWQAADSGRRGGGA